MARGRTPFAPCTNECRGGIEGGTDQEMTLFEQEARLPRTVHADLRLEIILQALGIDPKDGKIAVREPQITGFSLSGGSDQQNQTKNGSPLEKLPREPSEVVELCIPSGYANRWPGQIRPASGTRPVGSGGFAGKGGVHLEKKSHTLGRLKDENIGEFRGGDGHRNGFFDEHGVYSCPEHVPVEGASVSRSKGVVPESEKTLAQKKELKFLQKPRGRRRNTLMRLTWVRSFPA